MNRKLTDSRNRWRTVSRGWNVEDADWIQLVKTEAQFRAVENTFVGVHEPFLDIQGTVSV